MSVTFSGRTTDGGYLRGDDELYFNLANVNARAFLGFLGIEQGQELYGNLPIPEMRRAIIYAKATFDRRVAEYTRPTEEGDRWHCQGIGDEYFERRLTAFSEHVEALAEAGATEITWG